jgi:hypothetical protein
MSSRINLRSILSFSMFALLAGVHPAAADTSHVRVIRLSLVQGDVRFTRDAHSDPLADQKAVWETAQPNLPIRQGYVLATDSGRAEVEFENGAMAFLNENTVLEFYDLSLEDGARTTRLVLRQGSASFYVNPAGEDYFSVTGGDFTVEARGKTSFRVNNFDDGSNVDVLTGHVSVLQKKETITLSKGQSLSVRVGEAAPTIGRLPAGDDFDQWVSGRIDTVSTATNAALQYTNSPYDVPGFADLYTYGSWFSCGAFGYGWRPFGVGLGWSPFSMGSWMWDPGIGWTFASFEPWGWAPYHYGGWLFDDSCGGWFYSPPGYYGYYGGYGYGGYPGRRVPPYVHAPRPLYRASTAVFVRQNGQLGVVPMNPLDKPGRTPLNFEHGVFSVDPTRSGAQPVLSASAGQKWETLKSPARELMSSALAATTAPQRTSRTLLEGNGGTRVVSLSRDSSIVYDPVEHRFVNTNAATSGEKRAADLEGRDAPGGSKDEHVPSGERNGRPASATSRVPAANASARASTPPARNMVPPPSPRASGGGGGYRESGFGSSGRGGMSSRGGSVSSGASASHPASSGGGGGRPH